MISNILIGDSTHYDERFRLEGLRKVDLVKKKY
jgi:hypothetical protein